MLTIPTQANPPRPAVVRLAALGGIILTIGLPAAVSGQEATQPGTEPKAVLPGRIFVAATGGPLRGVVMIDPNTDTWSKIAEEYSDARVSPDGNRLVMSAGAARQNQPATWVYDVRGGGDPVKVFESRAYTCWSPDSRQILISPRERPGGPAAGGVWRVGDDGSGLEKLSIPPTETVWDWSSDGQWLVTSSTRPFRDGVAPPPISQRPVYLMHPDGTDARLLRPGVEPAPGQGGTLVTPGTLVYQPRFSPDSRTLLWVEVDLEDQGGRPTAKGGSLVMLDVDGSRRRTLLRREVRKDHPIMACWSPDGRWLALTVVSGEPVGDWSAARHRIEVVNAEGEHVRFLNLPESEGLRPVIDWR